MPQTLFQKFCYRLKPAPEEKTETTCIRFLYAATPGKTPVKAAITAPSSLDQLAQVPPLIEVMAQEGWRNGLYLMSRYDI
jgi:hypothetical protein